MVRAFIGIFLPDKLKNKIKNIQDIFKSLPLKAKFVEENNLHITLSFLGEIDEREVKKICKILDEICKKYERFEVKIGNLIPIPNKNFVRVVAFEVESKKLEELSKEIKEKIGGDVKPPHLTICRVKSLLNKEIVLKKIDEINLEEKFFVNSVQLIKSVLTQSGPIYSIIYESRLK